MCFYFDNMNCVVYHCEIDQFYSFIKYTTEISFTKLRHIFCKFDLGINLSNIL